MNSVGASWRVQRLAGTAAELHARSVPEPPARLIERLDVTRPALVLGSTQPDSVVDRLAAGDLGLEVARRRSGGGAVLLVPGSSLWVDVSLPRDDPLWTDDVSRSFDWLAAAWIAALADFGVEASAHRGGLCTTAWSRLVCFGGLGQGEVTVSGRKLVGLAQHRGRSGARIACLVHRQWDAGRLLGALALSPTERERAETALADTVAELPVDPAALFDALVGHLP